MEKDKSIELRERLIDAGQKAVEELISVAEHKINFVGTRPAKKGRGKKSEEEEYEDAVEEFTIAADKLKTAAQAKKLAIMDAFEILGRIQSERQVLESLKKKDKDETSTGRGGFAEKRAKDYRS